MEFTKELEWIIYKKKIFTLFFGDFLLKNTVDHILETGIILNVSTSFTVKLEAEDLQQIPH